MKCDGNCFECPYEDCISDDITLMELYLCDTRDKEIEKSNQEPREQTAISRYNASHKRKVVQERYEKSPKGRERRKQARKRYKERHREEQKAYAKAYYEQHKDEIKAKRKEKEEVEGQTHLTMCL